MQMAGAILNSQFNTKPCANCVPSTATMLSCPFEMLACCNCINIISPAISRLIFISRYAFVLSISLTVTYISAYSLPNTSQLRKAWLYNSCAQALILHLPTISNTSFDSTSNRRTPFYKYLYNCMNATTYNHLWILMKDTAGIHLQLFHGGENHHNLV